MKLKSRIIRSLALVAVLSALSTAAFAGQAKALNPEQRQVAPIVNTVYWDLVKFWIPRTNPTVSYYDNGYADYWAQCNPLFWTGEARITFTQGFYCNGHIYIDYSDQAANISMYADGSVTLWVAHEFGHHIEGLLGISWGAPYQELLADCFAGFYFRHGVYTSRKLNYNDYRYDARNQIWALTSSDAAHGTRDQRLRAFDFGFGQTTYNGCINGWRNW